MKRIVVSGHGKYGSAIKEVIEFVAGEQKSICYIDFLPDESMTDLEKKCQSLILSNPTCEYIFVCDIPGATPFRVAATLSLKHNNISVIAGVNIPAILEVLFKIDEEDISTLIDELKDITQKTVLSFTKKGVK